MISSNLHACLVHESMPCVADLVINLRSLDPASDILLYDGSGGELPLEKLASDFERVHIFDNATAQAWGKTCGYIFDCMGFLCDGRWESITLVDSDQLLVAGNYSSVLANCMAAGRDRNVGIWAPNFLYSDAPDSHTYTTANAAIMIDAMAKIESHPVLAAALERIGWQGRLVWNFNPTTVYSRSASLAALEFLDSATGLREEIDNSSMCVGEEIFPATIVGACGFEAAIFPHSSSVLWRKQWTEQDLAKMIDGENLWIHPVPRDPEHVLRISTAKRFGYRNTVRDYAKRDWQ